MRHNKTSRKLTGILTAAGLILTLALGACGKQQPPQSTNETLTSEAPTTAPTDQTGETAPNATEAAPEDGNATGTGKTGKGDGPAVGSAQDVEEKRLELPELPKFSAEEYPKVDGSTATLPISYALYAYSTDSSWAEAEKAISHSKTDYAYYSLLYGDSDDNTLVIAYEPSEQIYEDIANSGVELEFASIGRDALVFLANEDNPVKNITTGQLRNIYTGAIRNWAVLGGEDAPIEAFQRSENSGSQTLMEKLVMQDYPMMSAPEYYVPSEMGDLIERVAAYNNSDTALGYSVYYYARNMYARPGLRFMSIDGVEPSLNTIADGEYPFVNDFYAVIRKDLPEDAPARQLYNYLTGDEGQALIQSLGYVPMRVTETTMEAEVPEIRVREFSGAKLEIPANAVVVASGDFYGEGGTTFILDAAMQVQHMIPDTNYNRSLQVFYDDAWIPLLDAKSGLYGLYDARARKWVSDTAYTNISKAADGSLRAYFYDDDTGESRRYIYRDGEFVQVMDEYQRVGEYYFDVDSAARLIRRYTADGTEIEPLSMDELGDQGIDGGWAENGLFEASGSGGSGDYILGQDGETLFSGNMLRSEGPRLLGDPSIPLDRIAVWVYDNLGYLVRGSVEDTETGNSQGFIYDIEAGGLITEPGDQLVLNYPGTDAGGYTVVKTLEDGTRVPYLYKGTDEPVFTKAGDPIGFSLGYGYYGRIVEPGIMEVMDEEEKENYRIPFDSTYDYDFEINLQAIAPAWFWTSDGSGRTLLYHGNEQVVASDYLYYDVYGRGADSDVLTIGDTADEHKIHSYMIDRTNGDLLHEYVGEWVSEAGPDFYITSQGSYQLLFNENEEEVLRIMFRDTLED